MSIEIFADLVPRYSQIHYWLRCTFPVWRHWTAKRTRKGIILHRVYKAFQLTVLFGVLTGLAWLQKAPQHRGQLLRALSAGKDWVLSGVSALGSR